MNLRCMQFFCSLSSLFKTIKTLLCHNAVKMLRYINAGTRKEIKTQMIFFFKRMYLKKKNLNACVYICIKDNYMYTVKKGKKQHKNIHQVRIVIVLSRLSGGTQTCPEFLTI